MALLPRFDTPASLRDLPAGSAFYQQWHDYIAGKIAAASPGAPAGEFYDPSETNVAPAAQHALTWMGFPRNQLVAAFRDNPRQAFASTEADARRPLQDEYFEWFVTRNAAGKITRVVFVAETPEYWELLARVDRARLVALYRELVSPAVQEADLFVPVGSPVIDWSVEFTPGPGQVYNRKNRWNTTDGIVHYIQRINTLNAALGLAQGSVRPGAPRDNYEMPQTPATNVDPRVAMDVGALARKGLSITLAEPIGLYIAGWDDTGFSQPNGRPAGDYWRILRGAPGAALRVQYEVPAGAGFVVGDLRIGGRPIEFGGQIAEHITVRLTGSAGARAGR